MDCVDENCGDFDAIEFLSDGSLASEDNEYKIPVTGEWGVDGNLLHLLFSLVGNQREIELYYFFTSEGLLAIDDDALYRVGAGTGLVGTWVEDNDGCTDTLVISDNATFSVDSVCIDPEEGFAESGIYSVSEAGDMMTLTSNEYGDTWDMAYKLLDDSTLVILDSDELFTRTDK